MLFALIPSLVVVAGVSVAARIIYKKLPPSPAEWDGAVARENFGPTFYQKAWSAALAWSKESGLNFSTKLVYRLKITSLKTDNFFGRLLRDIRNHKSITETKTVSAPPASSAPSSSAGWRTAEGHGKAGEDKTAAKAVEVSDFRSVPVYENAALAKNSEPSSVAAAEKFAPVFNVSFANQEQQLINQLAYNPKDVSAYKRLGWLYLENQKPMEARQAFKMAVKLGSRDKMIVTKLLEMGGTVHKEGALAEAKNSPKGILSKAKAFKIRKEKKIKIRKV